MNHLLFFIGSLFMTTAAFAQDGYKVGDLARDFNLLNVDGKMVSMENYPEAKGFVVVFSCNHCPYSVAYEDRKNELTKHAAEQGYQLIIINPNDPEIVPKDSYENMKIRAKEKNFLFPYLVDETQEIARTYGATRTPQVFLLNKEDAGLRVAYIGAIDNNTEDASAVTEPYVVNAIDALINNREVEPNFTRAIGCTIKWRK